MIILITQIDSNRAHLIFNLVDKIIEIFLCCLVVTFAIESLIDEFMIFFSILLGHGH